MSRMTRRRADAAAMSAGLASGAHAARDVGVAPRPPDGVLLRATDRLAETLVVAALFLELALVLANVVARAFFQRSFLWSDEAARLALSIIAFVGGAVAYRR